MKIKVYVHAEWGRHYKNGEFFTGFTYQSWPCKSDSWGTLVCEQEIDVPDVDEAELKNGVVKILKNEQKKLRAECEVQVQNIEQQIQEMLCLPAVPVDKEGG